MPDPKFPIPLRDFPPQPGRKVVTVTALPPIAYAIQRNDDGTFDVLVDEEGK